MAPRYSPQLVLTGGIGISLIIVILAPFIGMTPISPSAAFDMQRDGAEILWKIRFPRVLLGFLAGSALGLSGMAIQALFRNPLATPYTLGIASGAAVGAVLSLQLGISGVLFGLDVTSLFGLAGAVFTSTLVYLLSGGKYCRSTTTLLLSGVAVGFFFSSLILFLQYLSDFADSFRIVHWLMGGLEVVGFDKPLRLLPFIILGSSIIFLLSKECDLIASGEEIAFSRGVSVQRVRFWIFLASSLLVGAVVAFTGPIGFVGMMVPHMCRRVIGQYHHNLAPLTFVFSGAFLVLCDTAARVVISPAELPVGVVTALLGGPFFLWILLSRSSRSQY